MENLRLQVEKYNKANTKLKELLKQSEEDLEKVTKDSEQETAKIKQLYEYFIETLKSPNNSKLSRATQTKTPENFVSLMQLEQSINFIATSYNQPRSSKKLQTLTKELQSAQDKISSLQSEKELLETQVAIINEKKSLVLKELKHRGGFDIWKLL